MLYSGAADLGILPSTDQTFQQAWRDLISTAIETTDSEPVRQSLARSLESLERTWSDQWAEMSTRLAQEAASHLSGLSLEQLLVGQSVPGQEGVQQSVHVYLDHVMTDRTKDGKNHRARARVSGAGRAEVNQQYRFFVDRDGQGINAVRPLPRDVSFAHVRRGYND